MNYLNYSLVLKNYHYLTEQEKFELFLKAMENELKKLDNYSWQNVKQNDYLDRKTRFIYSIYFYNELLSKIKEAGLNENEASYAKTRWYNYHSAKITESLFANSPKVKANLNQYDKLVDFSIDGINFDHKGTVFPAKIPYSLRQCFFNKKILIDWLYDNQSSQGRYHIDNRLFIVFYDLKEQKHWRLKSEISLIKNAIQNYLNTFNKDNLITFSKEKNILSDVIFIIK